MSYFINPVESEKCVFLSYEGEAPPVELAAARYEANGLLSTNGWKRIVVDVTQMQSIPSAQELLEFAKGLSSDVPRGTRVALVVREEQVRHARLVETTSRGRGVFLTYFEDPEQATLWVKQPRLRGSVGQSGGGW